MGLFGKGKKKEKKICDVCGQEIDGYAFNVADGKICDNCRDKINGVMPVEEWVDLTADEIRNHIEGNADNYAEANRTTCPVCGREFGEDSPVEVADGKICSDCAGLMRGTYFVHTTVIDPENPDDRRKYADHIATVERDKLLGKMHLFDPYTIGEDELTEVKVEWIASDIADRKAAIAGAQAEYGSDYGNIYHVDEGFEYNLGAFEGGIRNAKALKGKLVVNGEVAKGSFEQGDAVIVISRSWSRSCEILKVVPCAGDEFAMELSTQIGAEKARENDNAWLVLDVDFAEISKDDVIVS